MNNTTPTPSASNHYANVQTVPNPGTEIQTFPKPEPPKTPKPPPPPKTPSSNSIYQNPKLISQEKANEVNSQYENPRKVTQVNSQYENPHFGQVDTKPRSGSTEVKSQYESTLLRSTDMNNNHNNSSSNFETSLSRNQSQSQYANVDLTVSKSTQQLNLSGYNSAKHLLNDQQQED